MSDNQDFTCFTVPEVHWMQMLNDFAEAERLHGFPMDDTTLYSDPRWLAEYEAGYTPSQAILRFKEDSGL
jgi:hypothetical protein